MARYSKIIIACLASFPLFVACKKKEKTPTKQEYLMQGKWKLESATAAGGLIDLKSSLKACQTDNIYTFNADKTITVDEGATKCSDTAQQNSKDGSWALQNNDAQIIINGSSISAGFGAISGNVIVLDAQTLKVQKDTTISSFSTTVEIVFNNVK